MKIVYNQRHATGAALREFGISGCYFKDIAIDSDRRHITRKSHYHTTYELHIITNGAQEYDVNGRHYRVECGQFLLLYPGTVHTVGSAAPNTKKASAIFFKAVDKPIDCFLGAVSARMGDNVAQILHEANAPKAISPVLIENNILELLVLIFRTVGIKETQKHDRPDENEFLALAKQYLHDNIETAPNVTDVAEYCHLSAKQLTRIFQEFEGITPGEYIIRHRIAKIEQLLADPSLSLKEISEAMNFNNEYYFNAFFKKHSGMPPGEHRKMLGK